MRSLDTTEEAHKLQMELFRRMGPEGRLQKALELNRISRQLLVAGVRQRNPDYDEQEAWREALGPQFPEDLVQYVSPSIKPIRAMTPEEALTIVVEYLEAAGIEYMITGSFASNLHGVPRTTQDADVLIGVSEETLEQFLSLIEDDFYVSKEAAREALRRRDMFNIIHFETAFKIDLIVRKQRPYASAEFRRRQRVEFLGRACWFASPEDTILAKLEWSEKGESERQYHDAVGVAEMQGDDLDWGYLHEWAARLGIGALYERLVREVGREG